MSDEKPTGVATAADFRAAQEIERNIERVVLPKLGKAVLMRRPAPSWFIFRGKFPATIAAGVGESREPTASSEELQQYAKWTCELLDQVMVKPRISLAPGPEEIGPDMISDEDLTFIIRWAIGAVAPDGRDLNEFRIERESVDPSAGR